MVGSSQQTRNTDLMAPREERKGQDPNMSFKGTAPVISFPSAMSCLLKVLPHPSSPPAWQPSLEHMCLGRMLILNHSSQEWISV